MKKLVKRLLVTLVAIVIVCILLGGGFFYYIKSGGLTAGKKPSSIETFLAEKSVDLSVPNSVKALKNPLPGELGEITAGRELYHKNCEVCHGYDGRGRTSTSEGLYPPPSDLSHLAIAKEKRTDGELFYFIQKGVRNTAMPAWHLPDQQIWELVTYIRHLPPTVAIGAQTTGPEVIKSSTHAKYVGSQACKRCHEAIYNSWKDTLMANVVRDPHEHPDAIIPDLSKPDPLVTFSTNDIAFVYGSKWKQRYFKRVGDDYYPMAAQWDITHKIWRPYFAKDDWWAAYYPPDNSKRPTSATCDGCHSVNYNISTRTVAEWNVGCEKCHGPGSEHAEHPASDNIINPARLGFVEANDDCIQCHSQGRPLSNPIEGKYYDWPVGFEIGLKLSDFWKLEEHKLGETTFTHFADGTAHKNRMQGNDFVTSLMYTHGVTCSTCHDPHGSPNEALLRKPANVLCLDCHGPNSPNGPFAKSIEQHTHHKADSSGSQCIACHMPKIAQTIADVNVRSHTFRFVTPATSERLKVPNACNVCHADKSTAWADAALKTWTNHSPWRAER